MPEPPQRPGQLNIALRLAASEEVEHGPQVVVLSLQLLGPLALMFEPLKVRTFGQLREEGSMTSTHRLRAAA